MIDTEIYGNSGLIDRDYIRIESSVVDLYTELNIKTIPINPFNIAKQKGYELIPYSKIENDGSVKQIRVYNKDHTAFVDIEYSRHQGRKSLHAHDYIGGERQKARNLSDKELTMYNKYFGGKK